MVPNALLAIVLAGLAGFVAATLVTLFGHALWLRIDGAWSRGRMRDGTAALYTLMRAGASADERERCVEQLRALPGRLQARLVLSLALSLDPLAESPLREVADRIGLSRRAGLQCRSRFWWCRLEGARLFSLLGDDTGTLLRLLDDAHPAVRRQAVESVATNPAPGMVDGLVALLDRPSGADLFVAQDALLRAGTVAVAPLVALLEKEDGPGTAAALRVAAALAHPRFTSPAIRHCAAPDGAIRAAAAELLGSTGGEEGTVVLAAMLDDREPPVRAAAARSLGRLRYWASAPKLACRMRDTSWEVRRAAGLALRAVGSPGLLVLRKMRSDTNSFAADMARQVLDLPEAVGGLR